MKVFNSTPTAEEAAALIAKLEARLKKAHLEAIGAVGALGEAKLLSETLNPAPLGALAKARKDFQDAESGVVEVEAALKAAKAQYRAILDAEKERQDRAQWKKTEKLLTRREAVALEAEAQAKTLASKLAELIQLGEEAYNTAPGAKPDYLSNSPVCEAQVVLHLRRYLAKLGVNGAFRAAPAEAGLFPDFSVPMLEGTRWIMRNAPAEFQPAQNQSGHQSHPGKKSP